MILSDRTVLQPDIVFFDHARLAALSERGAEGAPTLVVEIISPSSLRYDRIIKLGYYLALEIPEYWLLEPTARTFERFVHSKSGYLLRDTLEGDATFAPKEFRGLKIPLAKLWTTPKKRG